MIPAGLIPLVNHIWQSTLFALAVWLVTLTMARNRAEIRYRLWLAASLKFLLPFSLLVVLGNYAGTALPISAAAPSAVSLAVESVSPFSAHPIAPGALDASEVATSTRTISAAILLAWFIGFIVVLSTWFRRWRHAGATAAAGACLKEGPEIEMIRRLQHGLTMQKAVAVAVTEASIEPGLFGIYRPTLLLPAGIQSRLTRLQLELILIHELSHLRRRDNLAAFVHTIVEAIFWFHPLVWWIGNRMVFERELACDENVLRLGGDRQVYAEAILSVCEFSVASSLACVSGITRADLKKRIYTIVNGQAAIRLSLAARLCLTAAAAASIGIPILFGLVHWSEAAEMHDAASSSLKFARASIRSNPATSGPLRSACHAIDSGLPIDGTPQPGHCVMTRLTLQQIIAESYGPSAISIQGGADWTVREAFDIESEAPDPSSVTRDAFRQMFRSLLAERFKLALHRTTAEVPGYAIQIARTGLKLGEAAGEDPRRGFSHTGPGALNGRHMLLIDLARNLSAKLGRPVIDKTGLTANYDFSLQWSPGLDEPGYTPGGSGPSVFTAIQEQMGLRLEPQKVTVDVLVIDHSERPAEN